MSRHYAHVRFGLDTITHSTLWFAVSYTLAATAVRLYLEILFFANSRPLHRGLLSVLGKFPQKYFWIVEQSLLQCCVEYGKGGCKYRKFATAGAAASISAAQFQVQSSQSPRLSILI